MEDIEREFIELDLTDYDDPDKYWVGEDFDGWILDENGDQVFM